MDAFELRFTYIFALLRFFTAIEQDPLIGFFCGLNVLDPGAAITLC